MPNSGFGPSGDQDIVPHLFGVGYVRGQDAVSCEYPIVERLHGKRFDEFIIEGMCSLRKV